MKKKETIQHSVANETMRVEWHYTTGQTESLHRLDVTPQFEWIRGRFGCPGGACYLDKRSALPNGIRHIYEYMTDIRLTVTRCLTDEGYEEEYVWENVGKSSIEIKEGDLCVYATFAEKYDIAPVCLPYRAYTHDFCAHGAFYIYNARTNGEEGGVGLVLKEGCVASLGEERLDPRQRGDLLVNLPACTLQPGRRIRLGWLVFVYDDEEGFWRVVRRYAPKIRVSPLEPIPGQSVSVSVDDKVLETVLVNGVETPVPFACPEGDLLVALPQAIEEELLQKYPNVGGQFVTETSKNEAEPLTESDLAQEETECDDAQQTPDPEPEAEPEGGEQESPQEQSAQASDKEACQQQSHTPVFYWKMQGLEPLERWVQGYRHLGRGKSNPRERLLACRSALQQAEQEMQSAKEQGRAPSTEALDRAIGSMLRYYRYEYGTHRVDIGLPYQLIAVNEQIKSYFAKQVVGALKRRCLFGRDYVAAMAEMTAKAYELGIVDQQTAARFALYDIPLTHTPFGNRS